MAHLWVKKSENKKRWKSVLLDQSSVMEITGNPDEPIHPVETGIPKNPRPRLLRIEPSKNGVLQGEVWTILTPPTETVLVNGAPVLTGVKLLRDRDEIYLPGNSPIFFSTESIPVVEPFPGMDRKIICPRCRQEIKKGTLAVRCPSPACGTWHHMDAENNLPCWTYADFCGNPNCNYPTNLDSEYKWTPEGL